MLLVGQAFCQRALRLEVAGIVGSQTGIGGDNRGGALRECVLYDRQAAGCREALRAGERFGHRLDDRLFTDTHIVLAIAAEC